MYVGAEVFRAVIMKGTISWDVMLCSLVEVCRHFEGTLLSACLAYFSTLKMETVYSSRTMVNFYQATRHHILEDSI
jgi:hypothetical protein